MEKDEYMTKSLDTIMETLASMGATGIEILLQERPPCGVKRVFRCPECGRIIKDRGTWLGHQEFCEICAGELFDEFVQGTFMRLLLHGPLRWENHYLSIRVYGMDDMYLVNENTADAVAEDILSRDPGMDHAVKRGMCMMDVVCHCGKKNNSRPRLFRSRSEFEACFIRFCLGHYDQIRPLVT